MIEPTKVVHKQSVAHVSECKRSSDRLRLRRHLHIMRGRQRSFHRVNVNERTCTEISPGHPQELVDNLWIEFAVGAVQRREIKQRRGFQPGGFDYNESPTSSCQTFCWKARQSFDVPFFCLRPSPAGLHIASRYEPPTQRLRRCDFSMAIRDMSLRCNGFAVVSPSTRRAPSTSQ